MKLILTEDQEFLRDTAKDFAQERTPVTHFRSLRDNKDENLWDKDIWQEMVNLGWSGILIPEEFGGSDFGVTGISVILQECGKTLTPSPLFSTGVLGAYAISNFGTQEQKEKYLPKIVSGEITTALAVDESSHHDPSKTLFKAEQKGSDFLLNGKKTFVIDGASADVLIILARTSGNSGDLAGLTLFIVESNVDGIKKIKLDMADSRNYANIELRKKGVLILINKGLKNFTWAIPFYQLVFYKTDFTSIHAQGRFIRFEKSRTYKENKRFFQILMHEKLKFDEQYILPSYDP